MYLKTSQIASSLGITTRRVEQLVAEGYARKAPKRGECHAPWMIHLYAGLKEAARRKDQKIPPTDAGLAVCISWNALERIEGPPSKASIDLLAGAFELEGFTRDECLIYLGRARQWWGR